MRVPREVILGVEVDGVGVGVGVFGFAVVGVERRWMSLKEEQGKVGADGD